jgi:hypothetical protein
MKIDKSYNVGDTVRYETFTGELRTIKVTAKLDEVKNGRAGFDGYVVGDKNFTVWGYNTQILRVYCKDLGRWK